MMLVNIECGSKDNILEYFKFLALNFKAWELGGFKTFSVGVYNLIEEVNSDTENCTVSLQIFHLSEVTIYEERNQNFQ